MGPLMWRMLKQSNWDSMEQIAPESKISWEAILCWILVTAGLRIWISFFPCLCLQKHQAALLAQVWLEAPRQQTFKLHLTNTVANAFYFFLFLFIYFIFHCKTDNLVEIVDGEEIFQMDLY